MTCCISYAKCLYFKVSVTCDWASGRVDRKLGRSGALGKSPGLLKLGLSPSLTFHSALTSGVETGTAESVSRATGQVTNSTGISKPIPKFLVQGQGKLLV